MYIQKQRLKIKKCAHAILKILKLVYIKMGLALGCTGLALGCTGLHWAPWGVHWACTGDVCGVTKLCGAVASVLGLALAASWVAPPRANKCRFCPDPPLSVGLGW